MSPARFKDLCLDVDDVPVMSAFWSSALGLRAEPLDDGDAVLRGPTPQHSVWLNHVPEPRTVKQRVHLDVHTGSLAELEGLGARVLPGWGPFRWTVMGDPEGGELCAFVRDEPPAYRLYEVVVDVLDRRAAADWWAAAWGVQATHDDGVSFLDDVPGMPFEAFSFVEVPESKAVKNRVHWDVDVDDPAGVERLLADGAELLRPRGHGTAWDVLRDPEGHEFCVFTADAGA